MYLSKPTVIKLLVPKQKVLKGVLPDRYDGHVILHLISQSELPRPIPQNSVKSDQGCTSRIYFNNAGDKVMPTLYN